MKDCAFPRNLTSSRTFNDVAYAVCSNSVVSFSLSYGAWRIWASSITTSGSVSINNGLLYFGDSDGVSFLNLSSCAAGEAPTDGACVPCPPGYYRNSTMRLTGPDGCAVCNAGAVASNLGSTSCTLCPAGSYAASALACVTCSPGTFSSAAGSTKCANCLVGFFADQANQTRCSPCAAGSYANLNASASCVLCPLGSSQVKP